MFIWRNGQLCFVISCVPYIALLLCIQQQYVLVYVNAFITYILVRHGHGIGQWLNMTIHNIKLNSVFWILQDKAISLKTDERS